MRRSAAASSGGGRSVYTIGSIVAVAWFTCVSLFSVMCSVIELKRKWIGRLLEPLGLRVILLFQIAFCYSIISFRNVSLKKGKPLANMRRALSNEYQVLNSTDL